MLEQKEKCHLCGCHIDDVVLGCVTQLHVSVRQVVKPSKLSPGKLSPIKVNGSHTQTKFSLATRKRSRTSGLSSLAVKEQL